MTTICPLKDQHGRRHTGLSLDTLQAHWTGGAQLRCLFEGSSATEPSHAATELGPSVMLACPVCPPGRLDPEEQLQATCFQSASSCTTRPTQLLRRVRDAAPGPWLSQKQLSLAVCSAFFRTVHSFSTWGSARWMGWWGKSDDRPPHSQSFSGDLPKPSPNSVTMG